MLSLTTVWLLSILFSLFFCHQLQLKEGIDEELERICKEARINHYISVHMIVTIVATKCIHGRDLREKLSELNLAFVPTIWVPLDDTCFSIHFCRGNILSDTKDNHILVICRPQFKFWSSLPLALPFHLILSVFPCWHNFGLCCEKMYFVIEYSSNVTIVSSDC